MQLALCIIVRSVRRVLCNPSGQHMWSAADNEITKNRLDEKFDTKVVHFFLEPFRDLDPPGPLLFCIPMPTRCNFWCFVFYRSQNFDLKKILEQKIFWSTFSHLHHFWSTFSHLQQIQCKKVHHFCVEFLILSISLSAADHIKDPTNSVTHGVQR